MCTMRDSLRKAQRRQLWGRRHGDRSMPVIGVLVSWTASSRSSPSLVERDPAFAEREKDSGVASCSAPLSLETVRSRPAAEETPPSILEKISTYPTHRVVTAPRVAEFSGGSDRSDAGCCHRSPSAKRNRVPCGSASAVPPIPAAQPPSDSVLCESHFGQMAPKLGAGQ